jgi:hypothetical protein
MVIVHVRFWAHDDQGSLRWDFRWAFDVVELRRSDYETDHGSVVDMKLNCRWCWSTCFGVASVCCCQPVLAVLANQQTETGASVKVANHQSMLLNKRREPYLTLPLSTKQPAAVTAASNTNCHTKDPDSAKSHQLAGHGIPSKWQQWPLHFKCSLKLHRPCLANSQAAVAASPTSMHCSWPTCSDQHSQTQLRHHAALWGPTQTLHCQTLTGNITHTTSYTALAANGTRCTPRCAVSTTLKPVLALGLL